MRRIALAATLALALASPAAAAVELKQPRVSEYPVVEVTAVTSSPRTIAPPLEENGRPVAGLVAENLGDSKSVVLAIDRSRSMKGQALGDAVEAARRFLAAKPEGDRIAVVAFGSEALQLTQFSGATIDADLALRGLSIDAAQGTALADAVVLGSRALAAESGAHVLILLTDGNDISSTAGPEDAVAAARAAGVAVYAIGIEGPQFSPEPLERLAEATGGGYYAAASSAALHATYDAIANELARTWRLRYVTAARPGERLRLSSGDAEALVRLDGRSAPKEEPSDLLPRGIYESELGPFVLGLAVGLLLLLAIAFAARSRRGSWLAGRLDPHLERDKLARAVAAKERFAAGSGLLQATESAFQHLKFWQATRRLLERADVPLRTVEFLYLVVGAAFALGLVAAVAAQATLVVLGAIAVGAALPFAFLKLRAGRRTRAFENQLPDLLLTLAASLKAGHSFKQGIQTVVDEGQAPASMEFRRVLTEVQLGRPMDESLGEMADRVQSKNLDFVITAVTIQGQVGGSLAGLFDMVAEAVRQRQQFARKIRGLTAMGRASAYVLVGLPFFIAGTITMLNRDYMDPLYHTSSGHMLIGLGFGMIAVGSLVLRKIVSFRG